MTKLKYKDLKIRFIVFLVSTYLIGSAWVWTKSLVLSVPFIFLLVADYYYFVKVWSERRKRLSG